MPSLPFTAPGFALVAVRQLDSNHLRVTYSSTPKKISPAGSTDSLNPGNYSISGPSTVQVLGVAGVATDSSSVDLTTTQMQAGSYQLQVNNVAPA